MPQLRDFSHFSAGYEVLQRAFVYSSWRLLHTGASNPSLVHSVAGVSKFQVYARRSSIGCNALYVVLFYVDSSTEPL